MTSESTGPESLKEFYYTSESYLGHLEQKSAAYFAPYISCVRRYVPAGARLLEVGCGSGLSSRLLHSAGFKVVGTDLSPLFIRQACCSTPPPGLAYQTADAEHLPFPADAFDAVCAMEFIEHVPDPARVLDEMIRVVRPGGWLILQGPNMFSPLLVLRDFPALLRGRGRPPFYEDMPSAIRFEWECLRGTLRKAMARRAEFVPLVPRLDDPRAVHGGDFDAVYRSCQIDLVRHLKARGMMVLQSGYRSSRKRLSRWVGRWLAWLTPAMEVVAVKR